MGRRRTRNFSLRLGLAICTVCACSSAYQRWRLRAGAVQQCENPQPPQPREQRWESLRSSSMAEPFDVLVVGGGLTGLYTAVDAAQRGLRVALVEARDFGSGNTSQMPILTPGAFPYVQRALRQRDLLWFQRAKEALMAGHVWRNVAPDATAASSFVASALTNEMSEVPVMPSSSMPACGRTTPTYTLLPALHRSEVVEFCVAAAISTMMSPFYGAWRPCWVVGGHNLREGLPGIQGDVFGGIQSNDLPLSGTVAAVQLARTAEALGVVPLSYAALTAVREHVEQDSCQRTFCAKIRDEIDPQHRTVEAHCRSIINCTGAWVDEVRALLPGNATDPIPSATGRIPTYSYAIVPQEALLNASTGERMMDHLPRGTSALHVSSTRFSFSSVMVLPWYQGTMLVGPTIAVMEHIQPPCTSTYSMQGAPSSAQRERMASGLESCGLKMDPSRNVLSTVDVLAPSMKLPSEVPFAAEVMRRGHCIYVSQQRKAEETDKTTATQPAPFVHVYGGTPLFARDIAESAVDALLTQTSAVDGATKEKIRPCATRFLRLMPLTLMPEGSEPSTEDKLRALLRPEVYVERLEDLFFRRLLVGYTSPGEAAAALPHVAKLVARERGWSAERTAAEVQSVRVCLSGSGS